MGYGDLSAYRANGINTPNIDRLADEGIRFDQFYVNAPICSPSRVAVTTGQYPLRWDITSFLARRELNERRGMANYLDPGAPSLARMLEDSGYYTAHMGKWHLGGQRNVVGPLITEYGFNTSLTQFEGLGDRLGLVFETRSWSCCGNRFPLSVGQADLEPGEVKWVKRYKEPEHFVDSTMKQMQKAEAANRPFYINLWTDAVHTPLEAPPSRRGSGSIEDHYKGVTRELDHQLGRIMDRIRGNPGLRDNTLVVFASDNGPSNRIGSNGPFRGHKGTLFEGGIRTPFIVWAPGLMEEDKKGSVNDQTIVAGMDLPSSLLSIAGVNKPEEVQFDGLDMSSVLLGESVQKRNEPVMWVRPPRDQ